MIKYMRFDAVSFLKDSKTWEEEKRKKQMELESITELPAMSNDSPSRSGKISDSVFNVAAQRERLEFEISRLNTYQQALCYARKMLSEAQNEVIDVFFFRSGYIPPLIENYGYKYALCRSDVYKARREALDELSRIIEERYEL